jgi:hypothetical protein
MTNQMRSDETSATGDEDAFACMAGEMLDGWESLGWCVCDSGYFAGW